MSWVRIDDKIAFGAKVLAAGNEAVGAWVRMMAWSADHLTDGRIPKTAALAIAGNEEVLARLLDSRMLDQDGENFVVHDFLDYNPSAKEVSRRRKTRAESGKQGGLAKAKQSSSKRLANASHVANDLLSKDVANSKQTSSKDVAKVCPIPIPDPKEIASLSRATSRGKTQQDFSGNQALEVLEALNAARKRAMPASRKLGLIPSNLEQIVARLHEGATVEDCLHVIAVVEAEVRKNPKSADWFDAVTPFRSENFARKLGRVAPVVATIGPREKTAIERAQEREAAEEAQRRGAQ